MKQAYLTVLLVAFLVLSAIVLYDVFSVRGEIERNRTALESLAREHRESEARMRELEERIERLRTNRRSVESLALKKYRMLRNDQYILHDTTD